ncbi:MAG: SUMF1/EgtB/PvdO family nonheme iron enzyme, partial [Anaerolineales bacterium]
ATPIPAPRPSPATPVERPASAEAAPASTVVGAGQPAPAQPATLSLKRRMPAGVLFGLIGLVLLLGLGAGGLVLLPLLNRAGTPTVEVQPTARPTSIPPTETSLPQPSATLAPTTAPTLAPTATEPPAPTTEPTATSILTPEGMVLIPAGTFNMGSDRGRADERPVHAVTLPAFFMDQYEVTNARYEKCVAEQGCAPPANTGGFTRSFYFGNPEFANHPAIFVSWEQAEAFCQWEGKRLPTEAEWEYSASGGDGRRYPWGDTFDFNLLPVNSRDTVAVGSFPGGASPFGVYDMAGNVGEWVADRYSATYYRESPAENPPGPEEGNARVYRGGSFGNANSANYTTTRRYNQGQRFFDSDIGFRCVMDLP